MNDDDNQRYGRQQLIKGWDQGKLTQGTVSIVGVGPLAAYTALPLAALGVGHLRIISPEPAQKGDALLDIQYRQESAAKGLEQALLTINPQIAARGIAAQTHSRASLQLLAGSDVIIDATNDPFSKALLAAYQREKGTPLISASCDSTSGKVVIASPEADDLEAAVLLPMYAHAQQDPLTGLQLGGVIVEEVKKVLMGDASGLQGIFTANYGNHDPFSAVPEHLVPGVSNAFKDKRILIVGAGALGCFLGPAAVQSLQPKSIDIIDYDTIEAHNLNRQVCFYDAVGQPKSKRLEQTLRAMSKGTKVKGIQGKFGPEFDATGYDLIFDAVDSFYTKAMLHGFALEHAIPLISGGTDYRAATVLVYAPGKTQCFDCQINLAELAIKTEIVRRTSCLQAPSASVIMTNQIAGALMVAEARRVLAPQIYGEPTNGEIKYIADFDRRGGVNHRKGPCDCAERGAADLTLPDPSRVRVEERDVDGQIIKDVFLDGVKL